MSIPDSKENPNCNPQSPSEMRFSEGLFQSRNWQGGFGSGIPAGISP